MSSLSEKLELILGEEVVVDKLGVAREQLELAIRLYFENTDYISQITLIGAAHGILRALAKDRGVSKSFKDSPLVRDEDQSDFINAVHGPQNYFKHADRDSGGKYSYKFRMAGLYATDAVVLWVCLGQDLTHPMKVLLLWTQLNFPELINFPESEKYLAGIRSDLSSPKSLLALARLLLEQGEASVGP